MRSAKDKQPPADVRVLQLQLRSVSGGFVTLNLVATDHRIVIGHDTNFLIGDAQAHAFTQDGLFIRSGRAPALLSDLHALGAATRLGQAS
jgi:hypothetical protein